MSVRFPPPLGPGDRIAVTSPSSGVLAALRPRLDFCVSWLRERGYDVVVGSAMSGTGVVSAPAEERAEELMSFLLDPSVRAVVPPWGGELAVEILPFLDLGALAAAPPTWFVGYSDCTTVLLPLLVGAGWAGIHGQNLMDTPYELPPEISHWAEVAGLAPDTSFTQSAARLHRSAAAGVDRWEDDPSCSSYTLDTPGRWRLLDPGAGTVSVTGRLVGGCIEVLGTLAGSAYGDVRKWAETSAPEGTIVYVEAAEEHAITIARGLWSLRLAGWFEHANAVLVGRTHAPASGDFTQDDAVRSALAGLDVPVILDVDCGHVVPQLALVNGALAHVVIDESEQTITQTLS